MKPDAASHDPRGGDLHRWANLRNDGVSQIELNGRQGTCWLRKVRQASATCQPKGEKGVQRRLKWKVGQPVMFVKAFNLGQSVASILAPGGFPRFRQGYWCYVTYDMEIMTRQSGQSRCVGTCGNDKSERCFIDDKKNQVGVLCGESRAALTPLLYYSG